MKNEEEGDEYDDKGEKRQREERELEEELCGDKVDEDGEKSPSKRQRLEQMVKDLKDNGEIDEVKDYNGGFAERFSK